MAPKNCKPTILEFVLGALVLLMIVFAGSYFLDQLIEEFLP